MTMIEKLPRWMRGSNAEELDVDSLPPEKEISRTQDCVLLALAAIALVASLCL